MNQRAAPRLVAAAVLAAVGVCLLVASLAGSLRDPSPRVDPPPGSGVHADPPGVRTGRELPPQWAQFRPTRLTLRPEAGGATAPVDPVTVAGGTLTLPEDADRVGWWRGGSRAASPFGTVVVAGHLDTATDPAGYLAGLAGLVEGDLVELASGSDRQRYRVTSNYLLPSALLSAGSGLFEQRRSHRLVLITCGGPFDQQAGSYRDNRVVEAVPVPG